jgi:hypothetical protein
VAPLALVDTTLTTINPASCILELAIPSQVVANSFTLSAHPIARHTRPAMAKRTTRNQ